MTSKHLEAINNHLAVLQGQAFFRPQAGQLKERLTQEVLQAVGEDLAETLSQGPFDLEVTVLCPDGDSHPVVSFTVDYPGVDHTSQIAITALTDASLEDLDGYLVRLSEDAQTDSNVKTLLRKKQDADYQEKGPASARLKVSPEWLKRVVPCTDYSYEEIEGKKYIREYYWSKELIERLFKIKSTKTTPEDLQYVAKECCEGDLEWARDLIARLKSPNRPESAPKEPQKNQGRPEQAKSSAAQPASGDRTRSRSRHRKPAREPGKNPESR